MVQELLERVVEGLREAGVEPWWINYTHRRRAEDEQMPRITVHVRQTRRQNHSSLDNVTVTVEISEWTTTKCGGQIGKRIAMVKVPKDASDKVIKNRVEKVLEYLG